MANMRVHELAKELNISSKAITDILSNADKKYTAMSGLGESEINSVKSKFTKAAGNTANKSEPKKAEEKQVKSDEGDDGKHWYYFSDSGKKYMPKDTSGDYGTYKIDGVAYCFDSDGALQTGWKNVGVDNADYDIQNYKYYDSSGKLRTGWYSVEPPEDLTGYEDEVEWFYFSTNGTPKAGPKEGEATTQNLTKINGKTRGIRSTAFRRSGLEAARSIPLTILVTRRRVPCRRGRSRSARETAVKRRITSATAAVAIPE